MYDHGNERSARARRVPAVRDFEQMRCSRQFKDLRIADSFFSYTHEEKESKSDRSG